MKLHYLFALIFVFLFNDVDAQWDQQATPQPSYLRDMSVVSDSIVWLKDEYGLSVSVSEDGGLTWITNDFPTDFLDNGRSMVGGLSAISATTAFVVVSYSEFKGTYKTTDKGATWNKIFTWEEANAFPNIIHFFNENHGLQMGDGYNTSTQNFEIYTTDDGGNQWNRVGTESLPSAANEWSINSQSYFRNVNGVFYFTAANNGNTRLFRSKFHTFWIAIELPFPSTNFLLTYDFKDENSGIVYDATTNRIYKTTNRGANWELINSDAPDLKEIYYSVHDSVYIGFPATESGFFNSGMLYSADDGITWERLTTFDNTILTLLVNTPSGNTFIGGNEGKLFKSTNALEVNPLIVSASIEDTFSLRLTFNEDMETSSLEDTSNITLYFEEKKDSNKIKIVSASALRLSRASNSVLLETNANLLSKNILVFVDGALNTANFPVISDSTIAVISIPSGYANNPIQKMMVYPNPSNQLIKIQAVLENAQYRIFDNAGRLILSNFVNNDVIDISNLGPGQFTLSIENQGKTYWSRFIRE